MQKKRALPEYPVVCVKQTYKFKFAGFALKLNYLYNLPYRQYANRKQKSFENNGSLAKAISINLMITNF